MTNRRLVPKDYINQQLTSLDLLIYRCTTSKTSQATWDKFLSLIRSDAEEILCEPEDPDLLAGYALRVIEEPALEGADWKRARDHFDEWVKPQLKTELSMSDSEAQMMRDCGWELRDLQDDQLAKEPWLSYFVFVDDASVASVVELDRDNNRGKLGGYYVTVVRTGLMYQREDEHAELDEEIPPAEDEEFAEEYWSEFRQKFRAWDLVKVYAVIVRGDWPVMFEDDGAGVGEIVCI